MDSSPICHPSPAKKVKCLFLDCIQLLMIGRAGRWTRIPSTTPLQPKKWNAHFWITLNFWWSARLVNGLEPHLPPLSSQKSEMLVFGLHSTSDDWPGWSMDFEPHLPPLSSQKSEMLHFWIAFNFWWLAGLVDGLEPHLHHPSPAKKVKCSFLDYVQLLMISQAGQWTRTPSATLSSQKSEMLIFRIMFNFWWSAGLVDGLESRPPPLSSQKIEMLMFGLRSTSDDQPGWSSSTFYNLPHPLPLPFSDSVPEQETGKFQFQMDIYVYIYMDSNPICHPSPAKQNEMLIFGLRSTSDDWPGWSMDWNPIHHLSPAKNMKCSF